MSACEDPPARDGLDTARMLLTWIMRIALALILSGVCGWGCVADGACKPVQQHAPELARRLAFPGEAQPTEGSSVDSGRALTPPVAEELLREVELLETQLPHSAKDGDLDVILNKLESRRAALEQALRDFIAIDPSRLQGGLQSGDTMPTRRGVVMSRNSLLASANTAEALCSAEN